MNTAVTYNCSNHDTENYLREVFLRQLIRHSFRIRWDLEEGLQHPEVEVWGDTSAFHGQQAGEDNNTGIIQNTTEPNIPQVASPYRL